MLTTLRPSVGGWILLVGSHKMNPTMLAAIARLGETGAVRVLDGGNRFNAYLVARAAGGKPEVLNRITVSRAFTCYQVLSLLESTAANSTPFVVLDLLNTFYDESVTAGERRRLLRVCITHLERLAGSAQLHFLPMPYSGSGGAGEGGMPQEQGNGGVVSAHPPKVPSPAATELLDMLQASAADTYFIQPPAQVAEPMRLF
jgi:hypothetical protein